MIRTASPRDTGGWLGLRISGEDSGISELTLLDSAYIRGWEEQESPLIGIRWDQLQHKLQHGVDKDGFKW